MGGEIAVKRSQARDKPCEKGAERELDLAGALHEVSNALTVVLGWLDAARAKLPEGFALDAVDVARRHADLGYRVARRAVGVQVSGEAQRSALTVARDVTVSVAQEARRRGVHVVLNEERANDAMLRDASSAYQILVNLLLNAIEFTPMGGTVTLALHAEGAFMTFRVTDEGPGIAPERAATLLSSSESTRSGGAGIGLPYSAALAESSGGSLRLANPGPGATLQLDWPIQEPGSGPHHRPSAVSLAGMKVLVIEDDAAVSSLIEFALEGHAVRVVSAASPDELIGVLEKEAPFDAALVDLSPFEEDTSDALKLLETASSNGASLILISGLVTAVPPELEGCIAAWVRKPFEMAEVVDVLRLLPRWRGRPRLRPVGRHRAWAISPVDSNASHI